MTIYSGTLVTTTPTINTASSTTILAANPTRKLLIIQNNSAANVAIGLNGETLTGIVPSATNKCYVLPSTAGANTLVLKDMSLPSGAITAYQTSGSALNTVVVIQG
jgi:hypothetical protein